MLRMSTHDASGEETHVDPVSTGESTTGSEVQLVYAARCGDEEAFRQLVIRYERRVLSVIQRFIADPEQAQDLVQESFLRAWRRLDQFDLTRRFGPWLFRLAVNRTFDHLRQVNRRGRWSLFSESSAAAFQEPAARDTGEQFDNAQEVRAILDEIPEVYRTVLILRDVEGFCTAEVAAMTDRTEATIRWRLAEARKMFRESWERKVRRDSHGE